MARPMRPSSPPGSPFPVRRVQFAASIRGLPDATPGPATVEAPGGPLPLVGCGKEYLAVSGVHDDIGEPRELIDGVGVGPASATVRGLEKASVAAGTPEWAHGSHVGDVGILGIHEDSGNVVAVFQPNFANVSPPSVDL